MRLPRWIHHLYANLCGYFWIPCPNCGRMFGGHEIGEGIATSPGGGKSTCNDPECIKQVVEINKERYEKWDKDGTMKEFCRNWATMDRLI